MDGRFFFFVQNPIYNMRFLKNKIFVWTLACISLLHLVLDSILSFYEAYGPVLLALELLLSLYFVADFVNNVQSNLNKRDDKSVLKLSLLFDIICILPLILVFLPRVSPVLQLLPFFRMFRILKIFQFMGAHSLIFTSISNKRKELLTSVEIVLIMTLILSVILFIVENRVQPENFGSVVDSFLWSVSKFIGDIAGYGDYTPVTMSGKILATFVGILGIAIFAVPAGIIASGFVEEIENKKRNDELNEHYQKLVNAFHFDTYTNLRPKKEIGLEKSCRRSITLTDAKVKLFLTEKDIFDVCALKKNIKMTKVIREGSETIELEYFDNNSIFGAVSKRNSNITIISTHSSDSPYLGHYATLLAEYCGANLLSVDNFGIYSFEESQNMNFTINEAYLLEEIDRSSLINSFISEIKKLTDNKGIVITLGSSMSKSSSFQVLNGAKKGSELICENGTMNKALLQSFCDKLIENGSKLNFDLTIHKDYGSDNLDHLDWYIKNSINLDAFHLYVNVEILKGSTEKYYHSVKVLGESIKAAFNQEAS
jgi:hypothetical protein